MSYDACIREGGLNKGEKGAFIQCLLFFSREIKGGRKTYVEARRDGGRAFAAETQ
jgi:hypothetical protein